MSAWSALRPSAPSAQIHGNTGSHAGAGVYIYSNGKAAFSTTNIHDNMSSGNGGGVYALGEATFINCHVPFAA